MMLTLSLLLVAMTALTTAADAEAEEALDVEKRGLLCPSGWTRYGWRCYDFVPRLMTWADAEKRCQSMNAHLASVHNDDEYHWIQKMIADKSHAHPGAWLGASDGAQEGTWFWSDGSHFKFTYWCQGEPNNGGKQNCLQMNHSGKKCWDDLQCNIKRASVCSKRLMSLFR